MARKRSPATEISRLRWALRTARAALAATRDPATPNETRIHLVKNALFFADQELRPKRARLQRKETK